MKILMISSEAFPLAKTGGLADAVTTLSKELKKQGHDVRLLIPRYYFINPHQFERHSEPLSVHIGTKEYWAGIHEGFLPDTDIPLYLLDHEGLYGRDGIYSLRGGQDFQDNLERFSLLSKSAFQICRKLEWIPDVLHAHDWPAALVPVYHKTRENYPPFDSCKSVFSIHNIGYQGFFHMEDFKAMGLERVEAEHSGVLFHEAVNLLHGGILSADEITTVSPTYAEEILHPEFSFQMDGILSHKKDHLTGILNGMDYDVWNPATDPHIPHNFDLDDMAGKAKCKKALCKEAHLALDADLPLIGMVSRLADQKGFAEMCNPSNGALRKICSELDAQLIVVGTGDEWCERELLKLQQQLPNLKVYIMFDNALAHKVEAACDFFLMPSKYEPCGLNQMYSLRYGTIPIVAETGGLKDTVIPFNKKDGNGFLISKITPKNIFETVAKAVEVFETDKKKISQLRKNGMAARFTWEKSVGTYLQVYQK